MKLLTLGNPKILKGQKKGYLTAILHFAPTDLSGYEVCPKASEGCKKACLHTAGRAGVFKSIPEARIRKTVQFFEQRESFMELLIKDIQALIRKAERENLIPCLRLNGTSDLAWEKIRVIVDGRAYRNLMQAFPGLQFYDYTKIPQRAIKVLEPNYHITFSLSESNDREAKKVLKCGGNVAVVFAGKELPKVFWNTVVINGDESDLRFLDRKGVIIGLLAKGKAKKDSSGFVKEVA